MLSDVQSEAAGVAIPPRVMPAPAPLIVTPLLALILIAAIGGYALDWGWTGFKDNGTVWDWLHLLLLPLALTALSFSLGHKRRWRVPWSAVGAGFLAAMIVLVVGGYGYGWSWTGFEDNGTVWDWLHLMVLPLVVVLAPFWLRSDAAERRWWQVAAAALAAAFIVLITGGYGYGWSWTGFRGNSLWDWFSLLLVPVAVPLAMATVTIRLERMERDREEAASDPASGSEPAGASGDVGP